MPDESPQAPAAVRTAWFVDADFADRLGSILRSIWVGLIDEAIPVTLVSPRAFDDSPFLSAISIVRIEPHWWSRAASLAGEVSERLGEARPGLIVAAGRSLFAVARRVADHYHTPLFVLVSAEADAEALNNLWTTDDLTIVALSPPLEDLVRRVRRDARATIVLVRPGIMTDTTPPPPRSGERTASCLAVGTPGREEDLVDVLRAQRILLDDGQELLSFLYNASRSEADLRRHATRLDLASAVTFVDSRQPTLTELRSADFCVLPTRPTALHALVYEALSSGTVMVAAGSGYYECLIPDQTCLTYTPGQPAELARCLQSCLTDDEAYARLTRQAWEHVRQWHQTSAMVAALARLFRRGQPPPSTEDEPPGSQI